MKDGLDNTAMKKIDKTAKKSMHWNVAPDALPVSARVVCVMDRLRNDWKQLDAFRLLYATFYGRKSITVRADF